MSIEAKQATPHNTLIGELMDSRIPKTDREHAAAREIERLRQAIDQAEQQEPVAWINKSRNLLSWDKFYADMTPLYTAPVDAVNMKQERVDETAERKHMTDLASVGEVGVWGEREWVGLTDEEMVSVANTIDGFGVIKQRDMNFARAIEAMLKEKNT